MEDSSLNEKVSVEEFGDEDPVPYLRAAKTNDLVLEAVEPQADDFPY